MFTLEDLDLAEDLEYIRANASQFLPADVRPDADDRTDPAADALRHPNDYLIVG